MENGIWYSQIESDVAELIRDMVRLQGATLVSGKSATVFLTDAETGKKFALCTLTADRPTGKLDVVVPPASQLSISGDKALVDVFGNVELDAEDETDGDDIEDIDTDGIDFDEIDFDALDMDGMDMDGMDLDGMDMDGLDLDGMDFDGMDLDELDGEDLIGSDSEEEPTKRDMPTGLAKLLNRDLNEVKKGVAAQAEQKKKEEEQKKQKLEEEKKKKEAAAKAEKEKNKKAAEAAAKAKHDQEAKAKMAEKQKKKDNAPAATPPKSEAKAEGQVGYVKQFPTGTRYEVTKVGSGPKAEKNQKCSFAYQGFLTNGKCFDKGTIPVRVGCGEVVPGFDAALVGMQRGESRRVFIPSKQGYGSRGAGAIPKNADLIFSITRI